MDGIEEQAISCQLGANAWVRAQAEGPAGHNVQIAVPDMTDIRHQRAIRAIDDELSHISAIL